MSEPSRWDARKEELTHYKYYVLSPSKTEPGGVYWIEESVGKTEQEAYDYLSKDHERNGNIVVRVPLVEVREADDEDEFQYTCCY